MFDDLLVVRNHVPLYFLLMRPWAALGESEFILRLFSVIWGTLSVALMVPVGRLLAGERVGLIAAVILATSPFHIWYSQEARMYTFLAFLVLLAHWFLIRNLHRPTAANWVGYGLAMAAAVYTHYLALLVLVAHYTFFSLHYRRLRREFRSWLATSLLVGLAFAAWGRLVLRTGGFREAAISWIPPAELTTPFLSLLSLSAGPTIRTSDPAAWFVALLAAAALLAGIRSSWRRYSDPTQRPPPLLAARLVYYWLLVPPLLMLAISLPWPIPERRAIYADRYLVQVLPALALGIALGLLWLQRRTRRPALAPILLVILIAANIPALANLYYRPEFGREDWRGALAHLEDQARPRDVVLTRPDYLLPLAYYTSREWATLEVPPPVTDPALEAAFPVEMAARMATVEGNADRAWHIAHAYNNDPHGFTAQRERTAAHWPVTSPQKAWLDAHYEVLAELSFTGIQLTLYDLPAGAGSGLPPG
jgi:hypothetical protein